MMLVLFLLFSIFYFPLVIIVGLFWVDLGSTNSFMWYAIWQLLIAKIVYEISRMLYALIAQPILHSQLKNLGANPPAVALLYVCRNDISADCLATLVNQQYVNANIFVLDDSNFINYINVDKILDKFEKNFPDTNKIIVLRRNTLEGYKAGNLNNWLSLYGNMFKYFVVFDSDSKADPDFVTELVGFAEHPENHQIGIFQSQILPWNDYHTFQRYIGALAPFYSLMTQIVGNRTNTVFSFGHNNLHRTKAIQDIGGFSINYSSEDTVATFELDKLGYRVALVNITSYEAEPLNIFKYRQRAIRWAGQTAELFSNSWKQVSLSLKFELSRQLIYYFINIIFFAWIITSLTSSDGNLKAIAQYFNAATHDVASLSIYLFLFLWILLLMGSQFILHIFLSLRSGIKIFDYFGNLFLSLITFLYITIPVSIQLIRSLAGQKVDFNPTNEEKESSLRSNHLSKIETLFFLGFGLFALCRYLLLGANPWIYFGGWWATLLVFTPIIIIIISQKSSLETG